MENLIALARHVHGGGGHAHTHHLPRLLSVPAGWDRVIQSLDADADLEATLRVQFLEAVKVLMANKLMRAKLPRTVLEAAGWKERMYDPEAEDQYRA